MPAEPLLTSDEALYSAPMGLKEDVARLSEQVRQLLRERAEVRKGNRLVLDERNLAREGEPKSQPWYERKAGLLSLVFGVTTLVISVVAIFVAIRAWKQPQEAANQEKDLQAEIDQRIDPKLAPLAQAQHNLELQFAELKGRLEASKPSAAAEQLRKNIDELLALPAADFTRRLPKLAKEIAAANHKGIVVRVELVSKVGQRALEVAFASGAPRDSAALRAVQELLNYRTFLNWQSANPNARARPPIKPRPSGIKVGPGAWVRVSESSFSGVAQTLDRVIWMNTVFENCLIIYEGGPVVLQNVWFVNCEFRLVAAPPTREFAQRILVANSRFDLSVQPPAGSGPGR